MLVNVDRGKAIHIGKNKTSFSNTLGGKKLQEIDD